MFEAATSTKPHPPEAFIVEVSSSMAIYCSLQNSSARSKPTSDTLCYSVSGIMQSARNLQIRFLTQRNSCIAWGCTTYPRTANAA